MKRFRYGLLAGVGLAVVAVSTMAAGFFTNGVPLAGGSQYPFTVPLTGSEQIPADTELAGGQPPQSEAITTLQLSGYVNAGPSRGNAIIGGDATTNLFQRGTAGAATTSATPAYDGPDRFFQWSTASSSVTVSQDSTAADLPTGYSDAFKLAHTNTTGGNVCMGQVVETVNSMQFQGQTAELDFHAYTGAGWTGSSNNMTASIIYGTGTNQSAANMVAGTWTNQTTATAAVIGLGGVSTAGRYAAIGAIPAAVSTSPVTEVGIELCYTASTTDTNDYIAFAGIQLVRNPNNTSNVSTTVGYSCTVITCNSFERRPQGVESVLQYRYYYQITENSPGVARGLCRSRSTTACSWDIKFPNVMRTAPTMSYAAGFSAETTTAGGTLGACSALAADTTVSSAIASVTDAYALCTATTIPAAGTVDQLYDGGGTGTVKASAEL